MAETGKDLLTPGAIAKELGVSDTKVKKAIKDLELQPTAKKGVCSYYGSDAVAKIKVSLAG